MPTFHLWRRALKVSQTTGGAENRVQLHRDTDIVPAQQTYVFAYAQIDDDSQNRTEHR